MKQPALETDRLILRPFTELDAPRVSELAGDEAISDTTLRIPYPYTVEAALEWIGTHKSIRSKGWALFYAINLKETGDLIGSVGIDIDQLHSRAEIGYWIGKKYWNEGYATEAASCLLDYAFVSLKVHKVVSHHFARNPASGRVLEKLGMKREGFLKEHIRKLDSWEDLIQYGMLDTEYKSSGKV
jgi:RimJ/RimL family protein N-acetyltransferase